MSNEWMQKVLIDLGFTEKESRVYLLLTDVGPKKAKDIANSLNLDISQLYRTLKSLENTGLVNASPDYPAFFSAVLFSVWARCRVCYRGLTVCFVCCEYSGGNL